MRFLGALLASLLSLAAAQNAPFYLLSTSPEIKLGEVVQGTLSKEDGQNFFDGSYLDLIKFYGRANDVVQISAISYDFAPYVVLYGPDGTMLANYSNPDAQSQASLSFGLPETGRYHIIVNSASQYDIGRYEVKVDTLETVDGGDLEPGSTVLGSLQTDDDNDRGVFYDVYTVTFDEPMSDVLITMYSDLMSPYLYLYEKGGRSVLAEAGEDWEGAALELSDLPAGTYEIIVTSYYAGEMGTYELEFEAWGGETLSSN